MTNRTREPLAIEGGRPVRDRFLIFGAPDIRREEIDDVVRTLESGWIGTGPRVARFEEEFRRYLGTAHAVAVSSCTAGLHLSLIALGVKPGDEVIVPSMTFVATANAVVHVGATPVLVDCERDTMNIDPVAVERAITPRTRVIVPVHFAGRPADLTALEAIARPRGIRLLEDAAHGVETVHRGRKAGTMGDCAAFSFYVTKNVITGEGGMVTTGDEELASWIKVAGLHGMSKDAWKRYSDEGYRHYEVSFPGFKYNLTDLQAALGLPQLRRVEENWTRRAALWRRYREAVADLPVLLSPPVAEGDRHAHHLFILVLDLERLRWDRDRVLEALQAENIGTGVHYRAVHLHPYYRDTFGYRPEMLPQADFLSHRTLSIPFSTKLTDDDVRDVLDGVRKVLLAATR
jgi:dTDP-4-amino-4,6-dideoxygalactose transaminase